jgi:hypothetical protein
VVTISPGAVDTPIYRHAANYIGRQIRPLPPVMSADRVVAAVVRALDHPRAEIIVGQTHRVGPWAHQLGPRLYDRLVGPIIHHGALRNAPADPNNGTVFTADPQSNAIDDGWRKHDHRVASKMLTPPWGWAPPPLPHAAPGWSGPDPETVDGKGARRVTGPTGPRRGIGFVPL